MSRLGIWLAEHGLVSDRIIRAGIRRLLAQRLSDLHHQSGGDATRFEAAFAESLRPRGVAEHTQAANAQHYEVPTEFFKRILGPRLKYSAALYESPQTTLAEAEEAMLRLTCARADLHDGQGILELGCGWGSLTLWMAQRFPRARITAITNSATQAAYVQGEAVARGLRGVRVLRANANDFLSDQTYDRIVSVEMFEHVRNYHEFFRRLRQWLNPGGRMFVHVFAHRQLPYLFESEGADNWMGRYFFTGGTMPSHGLLPRFAGNLIVEETWREDGRHYARTLEDWLVQLDRQRDPILEIFAATYGRRHAAVWLRRWRIFLLASAELFAYGNGAEWGVSHYRFAKPAGRDVNAAVSPRGKNGAAEKSKNPKSGETDA